MTITARRTVPTFATLVALVALLLAQVSLAPGATAHGVVDQFQPNFNADSSGTYGMSFTAGQDNLVALAVPKVCCPGINGTPLSVTFTVREWPEGETAGSGAVVATIADVSIPYAPFITGSFEDQTVHVDIPGGVALTAGGRYVISRNPQYQTPVCTPSCYSGGGVVIATWAISPNATTDWVFATYYDPAWVDPNVDTDADTVPDGSDNCPTVANTDQANFDLDGLGDACDPDDDNDDVADGEDTDDDNDGIADSIDLSPNATSDRFSDLGAGGMTIGTVTRNGWDVAITDDARGVRVVVSGSSDQKARIQLDGKPSSTRLNAGTYVITDPVETTTVETLTAGPAEVDVTVDGTPAVVIVEAGETANIVEGDDGSVQIEAVAGTITVTGLSGGDASLQPGETLGQVTSLTGKLRMRASRGTFDFAGTLTIGNASDGIAPLTDDVTLGLDDYAVVLSAPCFVQDRRGKFTCSRTVGGAAIKVVLAPAGPDAYSVSASGRGADLGATTSPVTVSLTIGDNVNASTSVVV
ncbi:MAG TPA: thrombospondin type 3 repeat-containing protein [Acidimicrobiales bacterium]